MIRHQFQYKTLVYVLARGAVAMQSAAIVLVLISPLAAARSVTSSSTPVTVLPIPVLAYYYIWYTPGSWDRAKTDIPTLGPYSSDDVAVMRQHIEWAKQAGITGFIVSWKNTYVLSRRLDSLVQVAREENFKLAIEYEGLDFNRNPIPVSQVASDLDYFIAHWGTDPVFSIFDRPLVVWSGTWEYSADQVQSVSTGRRDRLLILASERNATDYNRLAPFVDGDAYYWSSVNPTTFTGYADKLSSMSAAVHKNGGLWIAPAAPGFDARAVGGTTIVDRAQGNTLRTEFSAASSSNPDAIGIISWNEFSENSQVEPSNAYGQTYLSELTDLIGARVQPMANFDSDAPSGSTIRPLRSFSPLFAFGAVLLTAMAVVSIRAFRGP